MKNIIRNISIALLIALSSMPLTAQQANRKPVISSSGFIFYKDLFLKALLIAFGVSLLIALICCLVMKSKMITAKKAKYADNYLIESAVVITDSSDKYSHETVQITKLQQANAQDLTKSR